MATTARDNLMVILDTDFHSSWDILRIVWVDNGSGMKCISEVNYKRRHVGTFVNKGRAERAYRLCSRLCSLGFLGQGPGIPSPIDQRQNRHWHIWSTSKPILTREKRTKPLKNELASSAIFWPLYQKDARIRCFGRDILNWYTSEVVTSIMYTNNLSRLVELVGRWRRHGSGREPCSLINPSRRLCAKSRLVSVMDGR